MDKESNQLIYGRNPIKEALLSNTPLEKIYFQQGSVDETIINLRKLADAKKVPYTFVTRARLDYLTFNAVHQGIVARKSAGQYSTIEQMIEFAKEKNEPLFLLACFQIQDPHNLGSLLRTGEGVGLHGIIIPKNKSVGLTASVSKVSSGADNYVPLAKVSNLSETLAELKAKGIRIIGTHTNNGENYRKVNYRDSLVIVLGSEGRGLDWRIISQCDELVNIPLRGRLQSLNVGVAGALILYEVLSQRM